MAQKDLSEKVLLSYNDVFADVVNALLFNGEEVVNPNDLYDYSPRSFYKVDDTVREQHRDVVKKWIRPDNKIVCFGIENQTTIDPDMPLRVIGYDGADYRAELNDRYRYPIITLVLYYGIDRKWNKAVKLSENINIPEEVKSLVDEQRLHLFQIGYISERLVNKLKSDYRIVADYFVQRRKNNEYIPIHKEIKHAEALLHLLSVNGKDSRFIEEYYKREGEIKYMCEMLDRIENRGIEKGVEKGIEKGIKIFIETLKEYGINQNNIINELKKKYELNEEEALKRLEMYLH